MTCPSSEPSAPPVTMIGPSAPNGAPEPIAIAADTGFATAVRGAMRLSLVSTASIVSGMPCPRITGANSRQHADDDRAQHRGDDDLRPGMKFGERRRLPTPLLEEREVGDEADEMDQHPRGDAAEQSEHRRRARSAGAAGAAASQPKTSCHDTIVKRYSRSMASTTALSDRDYQALARFRHALRVFQRFSEDAARRAGTTPAQHQLLLAIRGHRGDATARRRRHRRRASAPAPLRGRADRPGRRRRPRAPHRRPVGPAATAGAPHRRRPRAARGAVEDAS